jgi:small-conductance mechanosensitive channel
VIRQIHRRIDDPELLFRARKTAAYIATFVIVLAVARIWSGAFGDLGTFLGLLSAGIAIALADVFLNLAGWLYIITRRPFKAGDRIEVAGMAGDVVDIRVFRFTLLEIGNWVDADQSTGRLLHIPNGLLFRQGMANYTEGFAHIWHEIGVLVTFESDWERAEEIIRLQLEPYHMKEEEMHAAREFREASRRYFIRYKELDPIVYTTVKDSGVMLTARLLIHPRQRRGVDDTLWRGILKAFAEEPNVELAYPTIRTYRGPEFG